jgi:hypothetical protein
MVCLHPRDLLHIVFVVFASKFSIDRLKNGKKG